MISSHDPIADLNLIRALALLLETRSVTAAARRAGVTQSAMSRTLGRLRDAFADPLLVRTGRGLELTARAGELIAPVHAAMEAARGVFAGAAPFDPRETDRELSIASTDFAALALLPPLLRRLEREAPRAAVSTAGLAATWPELLEAGTLDLAIGFAGQTGPGLRWQALFEDRFVCVARKGHSAFGRGLTLARYLALDHLSVTAAPTKRDAIDAALARQRRRRTVRVRTTHFLVAPALLRAGELVLTTGARVGEALCRMAPLELTACPVELAPLRLGQYWHERSDRDRAHMWFRALVKDTAAASSSPSS